MGHPALRDAESTPFWLDRDRPDPHPPLRGATTADLAVVGGGFSGLWTALLAKERDPGLDVVVLEGRRIGWAASGRNGGFCAGSLTHGLANGVERFPDEIETLERLGRENLDGIEAALLRHKIDCGFERTGELSVATAPWQVDGLREGLDISRRLGRRVEFLDRDAIRAEVRGATYEAGVWDRDGTAMLDPARLAWGLAEACASLGVRFHEGTRVTDIGKAGGGLRLRTPDGTVTAAKVALGTGAFRSPLRRVRPFIVPVYDYALMTEPLTEAQRASIGWARRQGIGDAANQFHYYRLTDDNRILWGGYDAVYYNGGAIRPAYDQRPSTSDKLAAHFFETFPQLDGLRFTHAWGGVVDTCSRFCAFFGTGYGGRLAYAAGFTGLGVGATRFGAQVMLDLLGGEPTPLTRLRMVRAKPVPFPPEPVRSGVIQLTRWSIARADRHEGRRNAWLRTLDRLGLGFDS
ncbi:FAD-dependent oxidoreductase [Dactylosporangium sp. NPDC049525]|uniref:NAD(P)/FAD-dependent oxidoreductase n=1 Tax=Dactylosporangium sp. NPDC049525 TaxID=3154730 RepID=UPI0034467E59